MHHIVIVGGGAGGLVLATRLGRQLGRKQLAKITLVDESLTHIWKPLLHEIAAGTLNSHEDELNHITHAHLNGYHFQYGSFYHLDRKKKYIEVLAPNQDETQIHRLHYDNLVIAVGSESNDFNIPGVAEHCYYLDKRTDADQFRQHWLKNCLTVQLDPKKAKSLLEIVIIGGGATGIELAAELHYTIRQAKALGLDKINPDADLGISLIESSPKLLANMPDKISNQITNELKDLNINVMTHERVVKVEQNYVYTDSGKCIPAGLIIWAAGIKASDYLANLDGMPTNRLNQIIVKPTLQSEVDEHVFAIGDCASCLWHDDMFVPPRAQAAAQQADMLAKSLVRLLKGKSLLSFRYHDYGSLVSLSGYSAVGVLMGGLLRRFFVHGKLAKLVYISLYKIHQTRLFGWWRVGLLTIANMLTRRVKPRLKLH